VRSELANILQLAKTLTLEELPAFLGGLEEIRVTGLTRLTTPTITVPEQDSLIPIAEAAARLSVSVSYLYKHGGQLPFSRKIGGSLLFSQNGIEKYIKTTKIS
jgi:predicted DNA-binding transcriptional regulator AlpA